MLKELYDTVVIGAGPAGLAAAAKASESGAEKVLIIERDYYAGGILNQCIHNGFGLHYFKEELTGPEYAEKFIEIAGKTKAELICDAIVLDIIPAGSRTEESFYDVHGLYDKFNNAADDQSETKPCDLEAVVNKRVKAGRYHEIHFIGPETGYGIIRSRTIILCMGCRERTRDAIRIPGTRPAGVMTAGAAQRYVNIEGYMPGKSVLILGSGDIGLIMARRMTLEGADVKACVELMPYSGGLARNIHQCLEDFDIPLYLSHTVTNIEGRDRLKRVTVMQVDENFKPIAGSEKYFDVDTLLLSVGLIPENELSKSAGVEIDKRTSGPYVFENMETCVPGIFASGNVVHVHDLVDFVSEESERAGKAAAEFVLKQKAAEKAMAETGQVSEKAQESKDPQEAELEYISVLNGENVSYTVPQRIRPKNLDEKLRFFFRVRKIFPKGGKIKISLNGKDIAEFKRSKMAPGEMEEIMLKGETIEAALQEAAKGAAENEELRLELAAVEN